MDNGATNHYPRTTNCQLRTTNYPMFCPKCGSKNFLQSTFKSYRCTDCSFHFFINAGAAVAGIITNVKKEVLFTIRKFEPKAGMLDLPGGFVDYEENAEDALKREIKEELGVNVTKLTYYKSLPNVYKYDGVTYHTLDLFYFCDVDSIENITVNDDVCGYVFEPIDKLDIERIGLHSPKQLITQLKKETLL